MNNKNALGLLEVDGVCAAFAALDTAAKAGNITVESVERTRQGCNVCIKMRGDVSSVNAAVEAGAKIAAKISKVAKRSVIPAPTEEIEKMLLNSDI